MSENTETICRRKRTYSELKITGLPLWQGLRRGGEQNTSSASASASESESPSCKSATVSSTEVKTKPEFSDLPLDSRQTALLVVDVQPEYWSECPAVRKDFPAFPQRTEELIQHSRSVGAKIIWVRADYDYEKSPWLQQFTRLHKGGIPPIVKPSSQWESFAQPIESETVLTKSSWSSTSNTDLLDILREQNIENVLVCGLITSVCVQHSAFGVFEAGFRTLLVTDACADRGKERHEAALALYGGYMYELWDVNSVRSELKDHGCTQEMVLPDGQRKRCRRASNESATIVSEDGGEANNTSTGRLETAFDETPECGHPIPLDDNPIEF